jgi:uncharacterized repeat protein (TIGR01451 family)
MQTSRFSIHLLLAACGLAAPLLHAQSCAAPSFSLAPASPGGSGVQNVVVGGSPMQVLLYDFNKDGNMDLATADLGSDTVTVMLGNGNGTFHAAVASPIAMPASSGTNGSRPDGLAAGDFNGDGKPDLIVALRNSGKMLLLLGDGAGGFASQTPFVAGPAASTPDHIAVGDFNGDGKLDIAVTLSGLYTSGGYAVFLGDGAGHFSAAPGSPMITSGSGMTGIVAGHFTGHAPLDLAITNANQRSVLVLRGAGDGSFSIAQTITPALAGTSAYPNEVAMADINSDGRMDLVVANFAPRGNGGTPVQPGNDVAVLLQNANGSFDPPVHVAVGGDLISVASGDFNADGHPDLATANAAWSFSGTVRFGDGTANFGAGPTSYSAGGNPYNVAVADLNNDGSPDVVIVNQPSNTLSVYLDNCLPGNHAPVAGADIGVGFVTDKASAFDTASVLANDTDADHDALSITGFDTTGTVGNVTLLANGAFHYDPAGRFAALAPNQSAIDTFRYTVTDGHGTFASTTVTITVLGAQPADLATAAPVLPVPLVAGGAPFPLTVSVNNTSAVAVSDVVATITVSSNLAVIDAGPCSLSDHVLTCAAATLAGNANATFTPTLRALSSATGNAQVGVSVAASNPDPITTNNAALAIAPIALSADAWIDLDDGTDTLAAGDAPTYTVYIGNNGPSDIAQAAVLLNPPQYFSGLQWTCVAQGGATCAAAGSGVIDDSVYLPADAHLTYTVHGRLDPGYAGTNFALTAAVVSAVDDPNTNNDSVSDTDTVTIRGDASVGVDLTASYAVINHLSRYTVVVGNAGPSQLAGIQIGSATPTGLTAETWSCTVSGGASCGGTGNGALVDVVTLPPGASVRYTVTGIVASTQDYLDVNAVLTIPAGVQDTQATNNNTSTGVPISLFRSGFEANELALPMSIAASSGAGVLELGTPDVTPTLLAQWQCADGPCAYVLGVQRANGAEYAILQRDGAGTWQASSWHRAAAAARANWSPASDAGVRLLLTDSNGIALTK